MFWPKNARLLDVIDRRSSGQDLLERAEQLVLEILATAPEGLTNAEVARATGLDVPVSKQGGYISWTLLRHLIETDRVVRVGRRYKVA
jgi:IclR helix-turn-helix domain